MKAVITGGIAFYERNRKVADFESKKAAITFNVGEGEDAEKVVIQAGALAINTVHQWLGVSEAAIPSRLNVPALAAAVAPAPAAEKPAKAKATKTPPAVPAATPAPASDPLALDTGYPVSSGAPSTQKTLVEIQDVNKAPKADPIDFDFGAGPATVIPDTDLLAATSRKAATLVKAHGEKGTLMLRELGTKFGATRVSEIKQEVRAQYLLELEALK